MFFENVFSTIIHSVSFLSLSFFFFNFSNQSAAVEYYYTYTDGMNHRLPDCATPTTTPGDLYCPSGEGACPRQQSWCAAMQVGGGQCTTHTHMHEYARNTYSMVTITLKGTTSIPGAHKCKSGGGVEGA